MGFLKLLLYEPFGLLDSSVYYYCWVTKSCLTLCNPSLLDCSTPGCPILHSVQFSCIVLSSSLWPHGQQHTRLPCPSPTSGAYSNSCPSCWWCHPTTSSSVVLFSSCLQSLSASGSFLMSPFLTSGGQSIRVSALASVLQWTPRTDLL